MSRCRLALSFSVFAIAAGFVPGSWAQGSVLVEEGTAMTYLQNATNPGIGMSWTSESFNDGGWSSGVYGVGYSMDGGETDLISTSVSMYVGSPGGQRRAQSRIRWRSHRRHRSRPAA